MELGKHSHNFHPRHFQAIFLCVNLSCASSPAATYWRLSCSRQQFHGDANSSASDKLAQALHLLSLDHTAFPGVASLEALP